MYFVTEIGEFQTVVGGFINIVDKLAKQVEQEKMKVKNKFKFLNNIRQH